MRERDPDSRFKADDLEDLRDRTGDPARIDSYALQVTVASAIDQVVVRLAVRLPTCRWNTESAS